MDDLYTVIPLDLLEKAELLLQVQCLVVLVKSIFGLG
jgi:hypothetical protein